MFLAFFATKNKGFVYTDLAQNFPVTSIPYNKYILVLYCYNSNGILVKPMQNCSDKEALQVYNKYYGSLISQGFKPKLSVMDNKVSQAIQYTIETHRANFQQVEPTNHQVNVAEQAIFTLKNHLVVGLASTHFVFLVYL